MQKTRLQPGFGFVSLFQLLSRIQKAGGCLGVECQVWLMEPLCAEEQNECRLLRVRQQSSRRGGGPAILDCVQWMQKLRQVSKMGSSSAVERPSQIAARLRPVRGPTARCHLDCRLLASDWRRLRCATARPSYYLRTITQQESYRVEKQGWHAAPARPCSNSPGRFH
eukprot:1764655-Rhodomonas_salina.1